MNDCITIQLTQGQVTIIDEIDSDLAQHKWYAVYKKNMRKFYAVRNGVPHILARTVLERNIGRPLVKSELCDHINGDTLDNRRCNLRVATHKENLTNRGMQRNNTAGFKGVSVYKRTGKYTAQIHVDSIKHHLGYFDTPIQAHKAYCDAALILHGEFSNSG